jgi:hypothetical protein
MWVQKFRVYLIELCNQFGWYLIFIDITIYSVTVVSMLLFISLAAASEDSKSCPDFQP